MTSDLCYDIINDPGYSVRILSIRDVKNLNQGKLRGALHYACRSSRPQGAPRLKALYVFGSKDSVPETVYNPQSTAGVPGAVIGTGWNQKSQQALTSSLQEEGDAWWQRKGRVVTKYISEEWINCLLACEGIIAFDTVLCQGPRHRNSPACGKMANPAYHDPALAAFAVPACASCGDAPEGLVTPDSNPPVALPLLSPPPVLSSSVQAATAPRQPWTAFVPRCRECISDCYCAGCNKWWCETCYRIPDEAVDEAGSFAVTTETSDVDAHASVEPDPATSEIKVRQTRCRRCAAIAPWADEPMTSAFH